MTRCDCWNIRHKSACSHQVKKLCVKCGARLCDSCAKDHHVHQGDDIVRYRP